MANDFTPKSLVRLDSDGQWSEFDFRLVYGPSDIGAVGNGMVQELYGYAWAILADKITSTIRIFRAVKNGQPVGIYSNTQDADWEEYPAIPIIHPVSEITHLAACFDQSARPVVAYERNEEIFVRQYDPITASFTYRGPFTGVDPVLLQDTMAGYYPEGSDVHLYYLAPDRRSLCFRVQRELYDTERVIRTFSAPITLDMAIAAAYQIQLIGSFMVSLGQTGYVVRSEMYPVRVDDVSPVVTLNPATDWAYVPLVIIRDFGLESEGIASSLTTATDWAYVPIVIIYTWVEESGEVIADATLDEWIGDILSDIAIGIEGENIAPVLAIASSWAFTLVVVIYTAPTNDDVGTQTLIPAASWDYVLVVIVVNTTTDPGYSGLDNLGTQTLSIASSWSYEPV